MYIDTHCHLDFDVFDQTRDELMMHCEAVGVKGFLVPATTAASWRKLSNLAKRYPQWRIAYGLHPYFLQQARLDELDELAEYCETDSVLAIGEIGLDNWPGSCDMGIQKTFFVRQLQLAKSLHLPVVIHARKSYDLVYQCLRQVGLKTGGTIHAFNGSYEQAQRFAELGFVLGMGGTVTYPRAKKAQRVLHVLDRQSYVLETDSPDMPLYGYQGQVNTPLSILKVAKSVATIRNEEVEQIAVDSYDNLLRVFPKWHEVIL
ncbi:TatD family hydrolase [Marinomonas posidonica]|uniref:TatD family hydrolase n=1 Tax=Marinomonas posidonica TaxID=936476 RepID=UPI0037353202